MLTNPAGLNPLTAQIIECGMAVHREFGAGMLESVYHSCFVMELQAQGLQLQTEKTIPLAYRGKQLDCDFRIDIIVEGLVVVEVKAVASVAPVHLAQVITYLKLTGCPVGLLINFNVPQLRDGVHRLVHPKLKEKK